MIKRRNYTFSLKRDNDRIRKIVEKYPKYAYILHDKDNTDPHYHYYIEFESPRSLNAVAKELDIPCNMLEQIYSKKGILAYLTHENQPDKYHYNSDTIVSNFDVVKATLDHKLDSETYQLILTKADDYLEGRITRVQMFNDLQSILCDVTPQQFLHLILQTRNNGTEGLSPFRVPCSKSPP